MADAAAPTPLHKLLQRQLKRHFGPAGPPPGLKEFLASVSTSYEESDADRRLVERSLELASQELLQRNASLREREREQQIIFDSVPAMIYYKDRDNHILRLNAPAARALGKPVEDLQGVALDQIFPTDVAKALHEDDLEVIRAGQPKLGIIESHPQGDGKVHWVRTDKVPYRDDRGNVKGVIVLSVDITDRREAEEAVRASEERYRLIVETATEGIWTLDKEGRTTFANRVMAELLGYTREEMVGRHVFDFMHPEDLEDGRMKLGGLMAGTRVALDFRFRKKNGMDLWTQASGAPMLGPDGEVIGALGMLTDITQRREAERKLKEAYERLQKVDKERMQFLNNAAHELGTPLTPIKLQIHLLKARLAADAPADQTKSVEILERNFERLARLVRDLLDSARLQAATLKIHAVPLDLRNVLYECIENYLAPSRQAGVALDIEDLPPMPVVADPSRLGQVFDNLLSNAVKFAPRGGSIRLSVAEESGTCVVRISDDGLGMRPEDVKRLFQPFTQVHDTMQSTKGGTGLGLYVSRGIIEALGGTVSAESKGLGKGSTFTVRLPLAKGAELAVAAPSGDNP
ncbi:MAG: PAS domain S-box protein [Thermoplasmatota archaeon]